VLDLTPLGPRFVARVDLVDLRRRPGDTDAAKLRQAFLDHKVLVLSAPSLTEDELTDFARTFGEVMPVQSPHVKDSESLPRGLVHPRLTRPVHDNVVEMVRETAEPGNPCNSWHADSTNHAEPEMGGVARAVQLPPLGGDTLFADMTAAYDGLSATMQAVLEPLHAVHDIAVMARPTQPSAARLAELHERYPPVEHPVIRTHPVTGQKAIFVNKTWTSHIVGLDRRDSDELLLFLFRQAETPEYQYRHRWQDGDVLIWDNRVVQHYAVADYGDHRRVLQRLSFKGDRPA
jgi:taurine dioxygenase